MIDVIESLPVKRKRVYDLLRQFPGITMRGIGSRLGVSGPTVYDHLRRLEQDSLVHKPGRHWVACKPSPWSLIEYAPHDGTELLLWCPSEKIRCKVVIGAYRVEHGRKSLPLWRERYSGFVVEPTKFMPMPTDGGE